MKKVLSIILCMALLIGGCVTAHAAEPDTPVILISGFMCSQLFTDFGTEEQQKIWGPDAGAIFDRIGDDFSNFISSLAGALVGRVEEFGETVGDGAAQILGKLKCAPDGSSVYPVGHYPDDPELNNVGYMLQNAEEYLYERNFCEYMAGQMDPSRLFCYQYDSRLDAVTLAGELREFIKSVKEYTGAEQVKLFALSYGGLIVSTYLTLYGDECDVDRAVLSVPALGGTNIPERIFTGSAELANKSLISFMETALAGSANLSRIFDANRVEWLDGFTNGMCSKLTDVVGNWGSIWSLCSQATYERLKNEYLDPVENKELIAKTDIVHNEIMPKLSETFAECRARGTQVSIICGTGSQLALGGDINGDVVLPASGVSGALTAPLGERFPDGYTGAGTARSLVTKLLLTDDIKDVYSDPDYPQFTSSNNSYRTVRLSFDSSGGAYLTGGDKALVVENLSTNNYIKVLSVVADGVELKFSAITSAPIAPGESVEIPFEGDIPQESAKYAQITVNYVKIGSINPLCSAQLDITVMNGEAHGKGSALVKKDFMGRLEKVLPDFFYSALRRTSLHRSVECLYDTISSWFEK